VATALQEAQTTTLDNFLAFLAKKEDVDMDFMTELFTEFKATMPTTSAVDTTSTAKKGSKKTAKKSDSEDSVKAAKRPPSAYNLFIKFAMTDADMKDKVMEKADPTQPKGRMLMKAAMELWAELPDSIKDKMKALYKENPNMTGKELYDACNADSAEETPAPKSVAKDEKKPAPKKPAAKKAAESEKEDSDAEEDD
jgi:ribosomal protein L12E/L44/L45/RPP1/RPP2